MSEDNKTCVAEDMGGEAADLEAVGGEAADLKAKVVGKELPSQPLPSYTGVLLKNKLPSHPLPSYTGVLLKNKLPSQPLPSYTGVLLKNKLPSQPLPSNTSSLAKNIDNADRTVQDRAIIQLLLWDWIEHALHYGNPRKMQIAAQKERKRQGRWLGRETLRQSRRNVVFHVMKPTQDAFPSCVAGSALPLGCHPRQPFPPDQIQPEEHGAAEQSFAPELRQ